MAIEARRGCGYRKVGGIYIMGGKLSMPCCRFPILLDVCPCCGMGIRLTRTWTWIDPKPWLDSPCKGNRTQQIHCPAVDSERLGEKVGLLNIGAGFYTVESFTHEAATMGISRRVQGLPRNFKLGETWVFLAHPKLKQVDGEWKGGIFAMFKPTSIEQLFTKSGYAKLSDEKKARLEKQGITPIIVPDDDKDHQGSVYTKEPELELEVV